MTPIFALGQGIPIVLGALIIMLGFAVFVAGATAATFSKSARNQKVGEKAVVAGCLIIMAIVLGFAVFGIIHFARSQF